MLVPMQPSDPQARQDAVTALWSALSAVTADADELGDSKTRVSVMLAVQHILELLAAYATRADVVMPGWDVQVDAEPEPDRRRLLSRIRQGLLLIHERSKPLNLDSDVLDDLGQANGALGIAEALVVLGER
jgi:hypothetical protein